MPIPSDASVVPDTTKNKTFKPNIKPNGSRFRRLGLLIIGALAATTLTAVPGNTAQVTPQTATSSKSVTKVLNAPLVESSWTSTRYMTTPQGAKPYLSLTSSADTSFLKFDVKGLPAGATIVSSNLKLNTASTKATTPGFVVRSSSSSWKASTLVESKKPSVSATNLQKSLIQAKTGATSTIPLVGLKTTSGSNSVSLAVNYKQKYVSTTLAKSGTNKPTLSITYTVPVVPPTKPSVQPPVEPPVSKPSGAKSVFAHYFPPYPISLDNKAGDTDYYARNYLTINGESNKHSLYGGLLRDRPLPRQPLTGDYQLKDLKTEVAQASNAGLDGFTLDLLSFSGRNWDISRKLMTAAAETGGKFVVAPNLDMTASAGKADVNVIAAKLAELYKLGGAYKLSDGSYVLSSFKAEARTPEWWSGLIRKMKSTYGINIKLISIFLDSGTSNMKAYAPVSYALGDWGTRNADGAVSRSNRAAVAHSLGVKWMAGIGYQDVRPNQGLYAEANNTETFRTNWTRAISEGADLVQLVTWNDYSENTSIAPSVAHGTTFLDIASYYSKWFKAKATPKLSQDSVVLTHRNQRAATLPSGQTKIMKPTLGGSRTTPRDTVEVLTMQKSPADIKVTVGTKTYTYSAPAGVSSKTFPLGSGTISVVQTRGGTTVNSVTSKAKLISNPEKQDLQYYGMIAHK